MVGEKEVEECRGVEELAKSSVADTEGKLKKAQQEYEKTYARANPAPEVVVGTQHLSACHCQRATSSVTFMNKALHAYRLRLVLAAKERVSNRERQEGQGEGEGQSKQFAQKEAQSLA